MEHISKEIIYKTISLIENNIVTYGWDRYDPADIRNIEFISKTGGIHSCIRKIVLLLQAICPLITRRCLGIVPSHKYITAYTTLANAYMLFEGSGIYKSNQFTSTDIVEIFLKNYVVGIDYKMWWQDNSNHFYYLIPATDKLPTMNMHSLSRANITLYNVGKQYHINRYTEIATLSAFAVLDHHQILKFGDGAVAVSYYYNSYDCTLNINSEYAQWLSLISANRHSKESLAMLYGIIRLLLSEQNEDGSWFYFSRWHMQKYNKYPICDCHHSATVINNILNIVKSSYIDGKIKKKLLSAADAGIGHLVENFFDSRTGKGIEIIGYRRSACAVQYAEAIFALCEYLMNESFHASNNYKKVKELLPKIVVQMLRQVNMKDGSVVSENIIRPININSIRWGNGPVLQAIATYLSIIEEVY